MQAYVRTNVGEFAKNLEKIKGKFVKIIPDCTNRCAIEVCKGFLEHSYPAVDNDPKTGQGGTAQAYAQGKSNIAREMAFMFTKVSNALIGNLVMQGNQSAVWAMKHQIVWKSESIQRAWESENFSALKFIFKRAGWKAGPKVYFASKPTKELHNAMRDKVTGSIREDVKKNPALRIHLTDRETLQTFIESRFKSIGKMANGWDDCIKELGGTPTSVLPGKGSGVVKKWGEDASYGVKVTNNYGDFNGMISRSKVADDIVKKAGDLFVADLNAQIKRFLEEHQTTLDRGMASKLRK